MSKLAIIRNTICVIIYLITNIAQAQQKHPFGLNTRLKAVISKDSLLTDFENSVYRRIYNPDFWNKCYTSTFTVIKIDIDSNSKVTSIKFSDSADSLFTKIYATRKIQFDECTTLSNYAKTKAYKNISIIIPVIYIQNYSAQTSFNANNVESLLKFGNKAFLGNAIIRPTITIKLLPKGNI
ncbi:hypothetical protein A0256_09110 [Mucilaginibacter sp. PAMC 26640]|nr:hypothetical protein A0256_09110 [Mucilaginibacter sp. PAMC 26640]